MVRLLGHRLVHDPADGLADRGINLGSGWWDVVQNCLDNVVLTASIERLALGERFVGHNPQRENV